MAKVTTEAERKLKGVKGYRGRLATYEYVRNNLDVLVARGFGTPDGPPWQELADYLTRKRQTNRYGKPMSRASARDIFERAKKDAEVAALEARTGFPIRKRQPSQTPSNWAPTPTSAPVLTPQGSQARPGGADHVRPGESRPRTGAEKIAALRQKLAERSGL